MIKSKTGSKTSGVDNQTIAEYKIKNKEEFIKEIRNSINDYSPRAVRRVEIPKSNGKLRPLGIPTIIVDVKEFFDNVNLKKLLSQLYTIGI